MEWIKSIEKTPEPNKIVLVQYEEKVTIGYIADWGKWSVMENMNNAEPVDWEFDYPIELWMELPKIK